MDMDNKLLSALHNVIYKMMSNPKIAVMSARDRLTDV